MRPRYRLRLRLRRHLPWALINLGIAAKGKHRRGDHSWYNVDNQVERCHYCGMGKRPYARPTSSSGRQWSRCCANTPIMLGMQPDEDGDAISLRLGGFAEELEKTLGDSVKIRREDILGGAVWVTPTRQGALGVAWIDMGWDLQVDTVGA